MSDARIILPVDGPGPNALDVESLTVSGNTVLRERDQIAGKADVEIADVRNKDPNASDYGLVVREASPTNALVQRVTTVNLASGASADLDSATIPAATTSKLIAARLASSQAGRWDIKSRDNLTIVQFDTVFTGGLLGKPNYTWKAPDAEFVTLAGAGIDENWRVTVTNLGRQTADFFVTYYTDEE